MSVTLSVDNLFARIQRDGPIFVSGLLLLDEDHTALHDPDTDRSVLILDASATEAVRLALGPTNGYLGGALMQAWVRPGSTGPELHTVYWVVLGNLESDPPSRWGPRVSVRPVPPEFDYRR